MLQLNSPLLPWSLPPSPCAMERHRHQQIHVGDDHVGRVCTWSVPVGLCRLTPF